MGVSLSDKLYFRIGEVAQMAGVRPSVLRFWETEFAFLKPDKSTSGQRLYDKREVELILLVRQLLYDEKFTIEGVRQRISPKGKLMAECEPVETLREDHLNLLRSVKEELKKLRCLL